MTLKIYIENFSIIPYVRMTQRGKFKSKQARKYMKNQKHLGWFLYEATRMAKWEATDDPIRLMCVFNISKRASVKDLSNLVKAVEDAGNGILWEDDRFITQLEAYKNKIDKEDSIFIEVKKIDRIYSKKSVWFSYDKNTKSWRGSLTEVYI